MSRLCTRKWKTGRYITNIAKGCARNRSRANGGVTNVFHLPGVGVEGDSSRDLAGLSLPLSLEKVVDEG